MNELKSSELVLAPSGSLYHINMTGEQLADDIFLVGDPNRVNMFKTLFDSIEFESQNREIHSLTGRYKGHRFTALSTGMDATISTLWSPNSTQPPTSTLPAVPSRQSTAR